MKNQIYDVDYFLNKFDAIPEELWTTGTYTRYEEFVRHCALGHCGANGFQVYSTEAEALSALIFDNLEIHVVDVNDGELLSYEKLDLEETPKQRIMSALILIKAGVIV